MAMVLGDLLAMIRQDYLDTLQATAAEAQARGVHVVLEPQATPHQTTLGQVLWHDLALNGQPTTVASEGVFAFPQAIRFGWGDALPGQPEPLQVVVYPFAWEAMPVTLQAAAGAGLDVAVLGQWLAQWALPAEPPPPTGGATVGHEVVHSVRQTGPASFMLDLGTAPLEAWQDLLEALLASGATTAIFGTPQG